MLREHITYHLQRQLALPQCRPQKQKTFVLLRFCNSLFDHSRFANNAFCSLAWRKAQAGLEARTAALRSMACRLGEICRRQHGHNADMLAGRLFRASAAAKIASASASDMREMVSRERVFTARKKSCDMSRYYMGIGRSFEQWPTSVGR
jgi:hypothetical protein